MEYSVLFGKKISKLGFGCMRFPTLPDGSIDEEETERMIDLAFSSGVNYFDTAYPYHSGMSEVVAGKCLSKYKREDYFLADKFPGHQHIIDPDVETIFSEQLRKCRTDYFDIYLLHNVYEGSYDSYTRPDWNIIDRILKERDRGRIKHLGFSTHADPALLEDFLKRYGSEMEICQIQYNYLDYSLQGAKKKAEMLDALGIPVIVMEPLRGGKLARLTDDEMKPLKKTLPQYGPIDWAFNFASEGKGVKVVLSGMGSTEQVKQNIEIFSNLKPLTGVQKEALLEFAETLKKGVPCTACGYCKAGCPVGIDIPFLLNLYNDALYQPSMVVGMHVEKFTELDGPSACIGCGACESTCPQKISVPEELKKFTALLPTLPSWKATCEERERIAKKLREEGKF